MNPMSRRSTIPPFPFFGACGFVLGASTGGAGGFLIGDHFNLYNDAVFPLMGSFACCFGIGGAVLGAACDVMKFIRDSFLPQQGPDADYGELPPFPTAPSKSSHVTESCVPNNLGQISD